MLTGNKIGLRARHDDDVPILRAALHDDDIVTHARSDSRPWRPISPGSPFPPFTVDDTKENSAVFSVVELDGGALAGMAALWDIDTYHRSAHIGMRLLPEARGKGYGTDTVAVLRHYAFVVRGLHRLQIETLTDNAAMIRAAEANGFVREGVLRSSSWVMGQFVDQVLFGLLAPAG
jgi:RimJ/RimL family protein N-acetyltransferase